MKILSTILFVLAALGLISSISVVSRAVAAEMPPATLVGRVVGAFLVPILLLIIGLKLKASGK